jgi:hypothetical protein
VIQLEVESTQRLLVLLLVGFIASGSLSGFVVEDRRSVSPFVDSSVVVSVKPAKGLCLESCLSPFRLRLPS